MRGSHSIGRLVSAPLALSTMSLSCRYRPRESSRGVERWHCCWLEARVGISSAKSAGYLHPRYRSSHDVDVNAHSRSWQRVRFVSWRRGTSVGTTMDAGHWVAAREAKAPVPATWYFFPLTPSIPTLLIHIHHDSLKHQIHDTASYDGITSLCGTLEWYYPVAPIESQSRQTSPAFNCLLVRPNL